MKDYALSEKQALSERTNFQKDFLSFKLSHFPRNQNPKFHIQREVDMLHVKIIKQVPNDQMHEKQTQ